MRTKYNFGDPCEYDFPPVDIEQDASISVQTILYRVAHGLPTGLSNGLGDYDDLDTVDDGSEDDVPDPLLSCEDGFEVLDLVSTANQSQVASEVETSDGAAPSNDEGVGSEATDSGSAATTPES